MGLVTEHSYRKFMSRLGTGPLVVRYEGNYSPRSDWPERYWMNDSDWKEVMTEAEEYEKDKSDEAIRYDSDKPMWNLLDWEFIHEVVLVLTKGASKYSPENWKKGMSFSRPLNSLIRHVYSWWRGENNDPETGCSHLAHACANLIFLFRYTIDKEKYGDFDDRPNV